MNTEATPTERRYWRSPYSWVASVCALVIAGVLVYTSGQERDATQELGKRVVVTVVENPTNNQPAITTPVVIREYQR